MGETIDISRSESRSVPPPTAGRREWIGLAVIALACVLYVMDLTVLHLAVPAISADRPAAPNCFGSSISMDFWWPDP